MPPQQGYALLDLGDGILDLGTHVRNPGRRLTRRLSGCM
jgi:hypothetical protein